jgi:hypothetical protein
MTCTKAYRKHYRAELLSKTDHECAAIILKKHKLLIFQTFLFSGGNTLTEKQSIEQTLKKDTAAFEELKRKLSVFFNRLAALAEQSIKKVRFMLIINILSAIWLAFYFIQLFHLSIYSAMPVLVILGLPGLLVAKLYLTLKDVMDLPDQIQQIMASMKGKAILLKSETINHLSEAPENKPESKQKRSKLKDLFSMSKTLLDIKQLIGDTAGMSSGFGSALMLASPIFIVLFSFSTAFTCLLGFLSLITGLFFVF